VSRRTTSRRRSGPSCPPGSTEPMPTDTAKREPMSTLSQRFWAKVDQSAGPNIDQLARDALDDVGLPLLSRASWEIRPDAVTIHEAVAS
jgi:hypothetical protein